MPDLPSPYKINFNNGVYTFITEGQREYFCLFSDITLDLSPIVGVYDIEVHTFEFSFKEHLPSRKPRDERVLATIKKLLMNFFENKNRAMVYVCDTMDGRGKHRSTLFRRWYENVKDEYTCEERVIVIPDTLKLYGSVIRRNDFPYNDILRTEVIEKAEGIMLQKFGGSH